MDAITTIALKNGTLAADTLLTPDMGRVSKIGRNPNGDLAGAAGTASIAQRWMRAFVRGDEEMPSLKSVTGDKGDDGCVLVIRKATRAVEYWEPDGIVEWDAPFYAIGSGWKIAMAALEAGASAKKAVEVR
jgi:hypothetical protein